ncbi:MAG: bifunctional oligoribonuclease/PAP phosphatase NrnA [Bacteroidales bacterium]|nr:bifunctional oligoribonuclease/PAP phosphatase NrnA [Bacteroidales bacterium]
MLSTIISEQEQNLLQQAIEKSHNVVIVAHVAPDGDAVGSSLALRGVLLQLGKQVEVVMPDALPKSIMFLQGAPDINIYKNNTESCKEIIANADTIFCLDFNEPKRVDLMQEDLVKAKAYKVMIDHHIHPSDFCNLIISYPQISSTSLLVYKILNQLGLEEKVQKSEAEAIYTGMMTDTGNFSYNSNDSDIYIAISQLLQRGIDKDEIYKIVCNTSTISKLKLNSYAISEKMEILEGGVAIITLTRSELNRYSYQKGDTEGLVNQPLGIEGVNVSIFFREESDYVKVSLRSVGEYAVNIIASELYNGGGHKNASGGEFFGTICEAVTLLKSQINKYI